MGHNSPVVVQQEVPMGGTPCGPEAGMTRSLSGKDGQDRCVGASVVIGSMSD